MINSHFTKLLFLPLLLVLTSVSPVESAEDITTFTDAKADVGMNNLGKIGQSAVWGDYNNDGWQDLILSNIDFAFDHRRRSNKGKRSKVLLFKSDKGTKFTDEGEVAGLSDIKFRSGAWADYDNNGTLDLAVGTMSAGLPAAIFKNRDGVTFEDVSEDAGVTKEGGTASHAIWADYNSDGHVDLFQASRGNSYLYSNNGDGTFTFASEEAGLNISGNVKGAVWFDHNNNGRPDLFIAMRGPNKFFVNNGDGTFTDATEKSGLSGDETWRSTSGCVGDYNGDGYMDLYVTNIGRAKRNVLYSNNKDGTFTDITEESGATDIGDGRTCAWIDYDADGRVDIFTTNHLHPNKLFWNKGDGKFQDVATEAGIDKPIDVFSATWADYDRDGFLDAFLNGHIGNGLMHNNGNKNNSLTLEIEGDGKNTNKSAIGARVELTTKKGGLQIREVSGGRGGCEQDMLPVYFGLGDETKADIVVKLANGKECSFEGVSAAESKYYTISETGCKIKPST